MIIATDSIRTLQIVNIVNRWERNQEKYSDTYGRNYFLQRMREQKWEY